VTSEDGNKLNPFHSILKKNDEDDLIIVKLDIETYFIEVSLAHQFLEDKDGIYSKLMDQFYFEHHVHLGDLARYWGQFMNGIVKESFKIVPKFEKEGHCISFLALKISHEYVQFSGIIPLKITVTSCMKTSKKLY